MKQGHFQKFLQILVIGISINSGCSFAVDNSAIKVKWGYKNSISPKHWGKLTPDFALCSQGKSQSPINIKSNVASHSIPLTINYHPAPLIIVDDGVTNLMIGKTQTIINDGHGVQLNFPSNSNESILYNNKKYHLVQFHMHTPSENKWQGQSSPLEIHFVHQGDNGQIAVIGVFVSFGKENPTLEKIINHLPKENGKEKTIPGEYINPNDLLPVHHDHYSFAGSLTTPPCSEGIQWIVMRNPITASREQIAKIKHAADGANARPIQPLNKRVIYYKTAQ